MFIPYVFLKYKQSDIHSLCVYEIQAKWTYTEILPESVPKYMQSESISANLYTRPSVCTNKSTFCLRRKWYKCSNACTPTTNTSSWDYTDPNKTFLYTVCFRFVDNMSSGLPATWLPETCSPNIYKVKIGGGPLKVATWGIKVLSCERCAEPNMRMIIGRVAISPAANRGHTITTNILLITTEIWIPMNTATDWKCGRLHFIEWYVTHALWFLYIIC